MLSDNVYVLDVTEARSSLIRRIEYNEDLKILAVSLRYKSYAQILYYKDVPFSSFEDMCNSESIGRYYLNNIKPIFLPIKNSSMSENRPKTKNLASTEKRYIDISINVREILKQWLHEGEKGTYLNMTLHMLPDGEVDKFGNLGMITQKVPKSVYEQDKSAKGPILGNAAELDWSSNKVEGIPGQETGTLYNAEEPVDDLPF